MMKPPHNSLIGPLIASLDDGNVTRHPWPELTQVCRQRGQAYDTEPFTRVDFTIAKDDDSCQIMVFSNGSHDYCVPIQVNVDEQSAPSIPEINDNDQLFFLDKTAAALVVNPKTEGQQRQIFFLRLHGSDDISIDMKYAVSGEICHYISHFREQIVDNLTRKPHKSAYETQFLQAMQSMPSFQALYPSSLVIPMKWSGELVTAKLTNESKDAFQARCSQIIDPLELMDLFENFSDDLKWTLRDPSLSLTSKMMFCSFYKNADESKRKKINNAFNKAHNSCDKEFINAFSVCENGWELGDAIIDIMNLPDHYIVRMILFRCEHLREIQESIFRHDRISDQFLRTSENQDRRKAVLRCLEEHLDAEVFHTVISHKQKDLLTSTITNNLDWSLYDPEDVRWGAILKAITHKAFDMETYVAMTTLMEDTQPRIVQGGPNLVKDRNNMEDENNYPNPEIFSCADYKFLLECMADIFEDQDEGQDEDKNKDKDLQVFLAEQIFDDLTNPDATWCFLRKNGKLLAAAKIRPDKDENGNVIEGQYYFGTFYAAKELRGDYGVGNLISTIILSTVPEGSKIVGTCAPYNPTLELYLDKNYGIARSLSTEGNEKITSKQQLKIKYDSGNLQYSSKSLTQEQIKDEIENPSNLLENCRFFKLDSSVENQEEFLNNLSKQFDDGYVLTRLFYERDAKRKPDLHNTYIIFEEKMEANPVQHYDN